MKIKGFNDGYYLVGFNSKVNDKGEDRTTLHFLYNVKDFNGYATMHISVKTEKLKEMLNGLPVVGCVYRVYTDKFLTSEKQLITYLKDILLVENIDVN